MITALDTSLLKILFYPFFDKDEIFLLEASRQTVYVLKIVNTCVTCNINRQKTFGSTPEAHNVENDFFTLLTSELPEMQPGTSAF